MTRTGSVAHPEKVPFSNLLGETLHRRTAGRGGADGIVTAVTCDSRDVVAGGAFVAIRGEHADGHDFIAAALGRGASYIFCERLPAGAEQVDALFVLVPDARKALAEAARAFYGHASDRLAIIGVTGTNGKTTTARLIAHLLQENGIKSGYIGTGMALVGDESVPLERTTPEAHLLHQLFARMETAGCRAVVMEVSSHALMLERVHTLRFRAALFTNLTVDHLDFHGSMEAYADAKARLFGLLEADGVGIFNVEDPWWRRMAEGLTPSRRFCCVLGEGSAQIEGCGSHFRALPCSSTAEGSELALFFPEKSGTVRLGLPGRFNAMNALQAGALGHAFGLPFAGICSALESARPVAGRMERLRLGGATAFVDYAHTPDALDKALITLRPLVPEGGRLLVLFGCGGNRDRSKRPVMGSIASRLADVVILTSDNPRDEEPEAILDEIERGMERVSHLRITDRGEAIARAVALLRPGDLLLVAGKGHEEYQEVKGRKNHFSDREALLMAHPAGRTAMAGGEVE